MSLIKGNYRELRSQIQPGDVIAFSGQSHFSKIIKWATRSTVSHVGIVFETKVSFEGQAQDGKIVEIMEATGLRRNPVTGKEIAGVQRHRMSTKLNYYDGDIWWLALSAEARSRFNFGEMANFLMHSEGKEYDSAPEVMSAAIDSMDSRYLGGLSKNEEDFSAFFCSELVAAALEASGVLNNVNCSEVTPIDLCRFDIFSNDYYQLKGDEDKRIPNFNFMDPYGFGV
ncbi:MAG: hypothetical protein MK132_05210 [Lentisphaerales bacterium]|nr:hypothetical protein [Lentisphaerales bacterium]